MRTTARSATQCHRWLVWLAVAVSLFAACAPTLSYALAQTGGKTAGFEICTSEGMRFVDADAQAAGESSDSKKVVPALDRCPFCLHFADRGAPPPNPDAYLFLDGAGTQVPTAWQAFFYANPARVWAPPRGPPPAI